MRWTTALLVVGLCASASSALAGQKLGDRPQILWQRDYEIAIDEAKLLDRYLFVYVTTKWCPACLRLDRATFQDPTVIEFFNRSLVAIKVDADQSPALAKQFQAERFPLGVIVSPNGTVCGRVEGYQPPPKYLAELRHFIETRTASMPERRRARQVVITGISVGRTVDYAEAPRGEAATEPTTESVALNTTPPNSFLYTTAPSIANAPDAITSDESSMSSLPQPSEPEREPPRGVSLTGVAIEPDYRTEPPQRRESSSDAPTVGSPLVASAQPEPSESQQRTQDSDPMDEHGANRPKDLTLAIHNKLPAQSTPESREIALAAEHESVLPPMVDGFCPVTLRETKKLAPGRREYQVEFDQRVYWLAGAEEMERFQANPAPYVPAMDGGCPVSYVDSGVVTRGSAAFGAVYRGRLYLFAGRDERRRFQTNPARYGHCDLVLGGHCPTCLVNENALREGSVELQQVYRGQLYRFDSESHADAFFADPLRYRAATAKELSPTEAASAAQ